MATLILINTQCSSLGDKIGKHALYNTPPFDKKEDMVWTPRLLLLPFTHLIFISQSHMRYFSSFRQNDSFVVLYTIYWYVQQSKSIRFDVNVSFRMQKNEMLIKVILSCILLKRETIKELHIHNRLQICGNKAVFYNNLTCARLMFSCRVPLCVAFSLQPAHLTMSIHPCHSCILK